MENFLLYLPLVLSGTGTTIKISLLSLAVSVLLGFLGACGKIWGGKILKNFCTLYTTIIRGVPDLILILLIFYGGQIGLNYITESLGIYYIDVNPFTTGVLAIGFIYGAYMTETFRGAIIAVDRGQIEAGTAFGMGGFKVFKRITMPLMVSHAAASFVNNWLVLIKSTALVSIIGLEDVVRKASIAGGTTNQPFTFLFTAATIYIVITSISLYFIMLIEKRYQTKK